METQTPILEDQPLPNVAPVISLVEVKLREILDFDANMAGLVHYAIWQRGIAENSPEAQRIAASLNVDRLWQRIYQAMLADHTETDIQSYVNVITKVQDSLTKAFDAIGGEVHELVESLTKTPGDVA